MAVMDTTGEGAMTPRITTFSTKTPSILRFSITVNERDIQHNEDQCYAQCHIQALYTKCHYAECRGALLRPVL